MCVNFGFGHILHFSVTWSSSQNETTPAMGAGTKFSPHLLYLFNSKLNYLVVIKIIPPLSLSLKPWSSTLIAPT